ncbi:MAG: hypothetical protein JSR82_12650 [Verrucomicrobia bacterium]|nr:hypothetical protein [Verrucomicrobiota bacterium]
MFRSLSAILLLGCGLLTLRTGAQTPYPDLLSTAATTAVDAQGRPLGFVTWSAGNGALTEGKTYAVFLKPAAPNAPGNFTRVGVVQRTTDPLVLAPLLGRGAALGEFASRRDGQLRELYAWLRGRDAGEFSFPEPVFGQAPTDPATVRAVQSAQFQAQLAATASLTPAQRLGGLMQRALTDAETAGTLRQMVALYPSIAMAHGLAWGGPLGVAVGATVTLEVREWDVASGASIAVVGRATLVAGQPEILPPPGAPVQVPEANPKGDLNIKLRWATPDALRQRALLTRGHNVFRVPLAVATARGWDAAPPATLAELQSEPATRQANTSAILTGKLFTAAEAANFGAGGDATTYYYADDNDRFRDTNGDGQPDGTPFADGDEFVYFATTRDLLGRDSAPSPGGRAEAARRIPPPVPSGLAVENVFSFVDPAGNPYAGNVGRQQFRLEWTPNVLRPAGNGLPADLTTEYEIFRLEGDIALLQTRQGQADLEAIGPIRVVTHTSPGPLAILDDALDPVADATKTVVYTIRAVYRRAPGGPALRSGFAPPVFGTLRTYDGPPAPEAWVEVNRARAAVLAQPSDFEALTESVSANERVFRLRATSRDLRADYAEFRLVYFDPVQGLTERALGRHEFAPGDPTVELELTLPANIASSDTTLFFCRVGNNSGAISREVLRQFAQHPGAATALVVQWLTGEISNATLDPSDPLAATLIAQTAAFGTVARSSFPTFYPPANPGDAPRAAPVNPAVRAVTTGLGWSVGTECAVQRLDLSDGAWKFLAPGTVRPLAAGGAAVYFFDPVLNFELGALGSYRGLRLRLLEVGEVTVPLLAAASATGEPATGGAMTAFVRLCGEAREFKIYRQLDQGALTLVGQGTTAPGPDGCAVVSFTDAMPSGSCVARKLFAQVFDRHGNPSPLVKAGESVSCGLSLPVPRLETPEPAGTAAAPTVRLRWFCPAPGVERFEFGATSKADTSGSPLSLTAPAFSVVTPPPGSSLKVRAKAGVASISKIYFRYLTPLIGSAPFPQTGPVFELEVPVQPNREYQFTVAALGGGGKGKRSPVQKFTWKLPQEPVDLRIPWPARPLPPVAAFHPLIEAVVFPLPGPGENGRILWPGNSDQHPVGVRIARQEISGGTEDYYQGENGMYSLNPLGSSPASTRLDFNQQVFRRGPNDGLLPVALYRQQVANEIFPNVSGDVVQCSPLITSIQWQLNPNANAPGARLTDPHIGFVPVDADGRRYLDLFLLDTQPVVAGARYRYFLLKFHPQTREIEQVIATAPTPAIPTN